MTKSEYLKPFMVVERFVAQEYVATCWYAVSGDFFTTLYHDTKQSHREFVIYDTWEYGWYDDGEQLTTPSASRIPTEGYLKDSELVTIQNANADGNKYYTEKHGVPLVRYDQYTSSSQVGHNASNKFYTYTTGDVTYYLKSIKTNGNHS